MRKSSSSVAAGAFSLLLPTASSASDPSATIASVAATFETPALFDDDAGGNANADDPAIWVNPRDPAKSFFVGTKKNGGLSVYDLKGRELQSIVPPPAPSEDDSPGRFNNVDILYGLQLTREKKVDVAVVTDRGRDQMRFYAIDAKAGAPPLADITAAEVPFVFSADQAEVNGQATAYGIAVMGPSGRHPARVFASRRHGVEIAELVVVPLADGHVTYRRAKTTPVPAQFELPNHTTWTPCESTDEELPQVEGMVVDEEHKILYMAQEDVGIWAYSIDGRKPELRLIDRVREFGVPYDRVFDPDEEEFACTLRFDQDPGFGGQHLSADAEGLTIYQAGKGRGYLLASSQGDSTFAVYERTGSNAFVGSFRIGEAGAIDSVEHSDGAAVINVPLGRDFPLGLFVTQDGENTPTSFDEKGEAREGTNFKLVPWEDIASSVGRGLVVDTGKHYCK